MITLETVQTTAQQLGALPSWLQAVMVLTPVVLGSIATLKGSDARKARKMNAPASVAQTKRGVKNK